MIKEFFKNIFQKTSDAVNYTRVKLLNDYMPRIFNWSNKNYDNLIYRACIDRIASQVGKLTPTIKGDLVKTNSHYKNLAYLLKYQPNEYMNRYDFFYKVTSMLLDTNNVFIYKRIENNKITGFYPIPYSDIELVECESILFAKFSFRNSSFRVYVPFDELIVLRRHYNDNEIFGSQQNDSLKPIFEVLRAINTGMINSVESSTKLNGIIKVVGNLRKEDLERTKNEFVESFMKLGGSGVAALDTKADFQPVSLTPQIVDDKNVKLVLDNFSINYGVCENILKGCANENEMNTFYELAIEPLMVQYSLEFTNKIFDKLAISEENEILFTGNKLLFASVGTKTALAEKMMPAGVFSINDVREMYGYNPIENGDKHILSLNYIDLDKANKYQVGDEDNTDNENENTDTKPDEQ